MCPSRVEKRLVVRERIIIRKHTVYEDQRVTADLAREHVEIETEEAVSDRVEVDPGLIDPTASNPRPADPRPADTRTAGY